VSLQAWLVVLHADENQEIKDHYLKVHPPENAYYQLSLA